MEIKTSERLTYEVKKDRFGKGKAGDKGIKGREPREIQERDFVISRERATQR